MFLDHFGLREDPFTLAPDPRFLYLAPGHREALASLYYSVTENRGCAVMAGGVGVGKTALLYYLRSKLEESADVIFLNCPVADRNELIQTLLDWFRVEADPSSYLRNWRQLEALLQVRHAEGRAVILIADDAHESGAGALKSLRTLLNLETPEAKLLQIVLAGAPSLIPQLATPELESLGQRVHSFCQLPPLAEDQVTPYIQHRLLTAGADHPVFTESAAALVGSVSGGVPLKINRLCYQAMSCAWLEGKRQVTEDAVWQVLQDLPLPEVFVSPGACHAH
ncbi:MAG TPA: AAA family ATPase [Bryobacteraceae bacterium]|nr:AAA family ATPase [Bryobacteraceae bacterium]